MGPTKLNKSFLIPCNCHVGPVLRVVPKVHKVYRVEKVEEEKEKAEVKSRPNFKMERCIWLIVGSASSKIVS